MTMAHGSINTGAICYNSNAILLKNTRLIKIAMIYYWYN